MKMTVDLNGVLGGSYTSMDPKNKMRGRIHEAKNQKQKIPIHRVIDFAKINF